ncbi:MAG: hypothetical protein LBG67_00720 [Campylobacteraceae bacterium]|jgi:hypothetical protein|nr:hypothetical protein [Campylobacteraceae bacterium]
MAYVNEKISKEDYEKYSLAELDKSKWGSPDNYWAIDRERERWFRLFRNTHDRDGDFGNKGAILDIKWTLYYEGYIVFFRTSNKKSNVYIEVKEPYKQFKLFDVEIPKEIENQKEQILKEIKKALEESFVSPRISNIEDGETCKIDLEYNGEMI